MTLPPVIRIFFAIDLPDPAKEKLGGFISALKRKSKSHGIRWTKPENLHITLHFLAEVKTEDLTSLIQNVRNKVVGAIENRSISFGSLHLFPTPYRPRVIVLEINPQNELANLAEKIGNGIKEANYDIETRPFRAHLTLGRIKHAQKASLSFLAEFSSPDIEEIDIKEVILFRSEPQPEEIKHLLEQGKLEMGHARTLISLPANLQLKAVEMIVAGQLSVRETENMVRRLQAPVLKNMRAPLNPDLKDWQENLARLLKMRVNVHCNAKGKGKIVIHYHNIEELRKLMSQFDSD